MRRQATLGAMLVCCLAFFLCATSASGQAVYGSIIGTVTDPQGNAIVGAKVTVTSISKTTVFEATTNDSGNYTVTHLIPDAYKIHIEVAGFKTYDIPSLQVSADASARVDAQLQVGAVTQTVEVTGEVPQLKTDRADVAIEFNEKYVENLPILNRNFTNFELLSPGTQKLVGWSHAATENPQGAQQIFVNGQHFSGTAFELDGTDNQDPILGIIVVNPNLDAIQESKIALQNYDAEFGKAVAGVVTVQTKSGTNELHGSGFYDWRGDGQQARDPFKNATPDPVTKRFLPNASFKAFGGAVGGPIIKNKLFAFGDYQGTRQTGGLTNGLTIPTAEVISTCNPATNPTSATPGFCDLSQYLGAAGINGTGQVFDPATGNLSDGSNRTAFAGNMIPIGRISPAAGKILALFPAPTTGGVLNNFVGSGSGPYNQNSFDTRIDYSAPRGYTVFGRFSLDYFSLSGKGSLGVLGGPGFGPGGLNGTSKVHNYSLATGFDKAIGTKWLTDLRFGWFRYNPQTAYSDGSTTPMTTLFGIPGLNRNTPDTGGLSRFHFNGNGLRNGTFSNAGGADSGSFGDGLNVGRCNCPLTEKEDQFQVVNNWTRIQGNHQIKFGADIRYAKNLRVPSDANRTGELNFDSGDTSLAGNNGLDLATFLLGDVTSFNRFVSTSLNAAERQKRWFFYGQDTYRVTTKFSFNYGLRWEIYFPETVNAKGNGGFANIDEGIIRVAGFGNNSLNGNTANTYKAFAPRIGIAYQYDPKTVVRLGYGRSFDIGVFGSNFGHVVTQNLPVLANQDLSDSSVNGGTNGRSPVFTLGCPTPAPAYCAALNGGNAGPPAPPDLTSVIRADGTIPLRGPGNNVDPRVRPRTQRLPTLDAWNVTLQRQLTSTMNIEVAYIGNKGTHTFAGNGPAYNANEAAIGSGTDTYSCSLITTGVNAGKDDCKASFSGFIPTNDRRRFFLNGVPAFTYPDCSVSQGKCGLTNVPLADQLTCCSSDIGNYFGNDASTHYDALQVKVEKRFSQGLQFLGHYTYSHAFNYDSGYFSVDPRIAYGPDDFNRKHVFVVSTVYELPFGKGKKFMGDVGRAADLLIGGWQISNTSNWSGGLPFTPTINHCSEVSDAGPCRPDLLRGQSISTGLHRDSSGNLTWFTPVTTLDQSPEIITSPANAALLQGVNACTPSGRSVISTFTQLTLTSGPIALPGCGSIGSGLRNSLRGPHAFFSDLSLAKNFSITEKYKAQFRFDAYNVFNHPVLGFSSTQGNTCIDCSGAGVIGSIEADASPNAPNGMRQLQFGLRFTF
jgi:hypothetical protein